MSPQEIAEKVEAKLQKLEDKDWRLSHAGVWQFDGALFARMWREKK